MLARDALLGLAFAGIQVFTLKAQVASLAALKDVRPVATVQRVIPDPAEEAVIARLDRADRAYSLIETETVFPGPPIEPVVSRVPPQLIVARTAVSDVISRGLAFLTEYAIVAFASARHVVSIPPGEEVVAVTTKKMIVSRGSVDGIIVRAPADEVAHRFFKGTSMRTVTPYLVDPRSTLQAICAQTADGTVRAGSRTDAIVTAPPIDNVIPVLRHDHIAPRAPYKPVVSMGSDDRGLLPEAGRHRAG